MAITNKRVQFTEPDNTASHILKKYGSSLIPKGMALTSVRTFTATLRSTLSHIILNAGETHNPPAQLDYKSPLALKDGR